MFTMKITTSNIAIKINTTKPTPLKISSLLEITPNKIIARIPMMVTIKGAI